MVKDTEEEISTWKTGPKKPPFFRERPAQVAPRPRGNEEESPSAVNSAAEEEL